ncbi:MAG: ribonuclease PH [Fusobacterium periodonticum]|nr:ribonuclease PH [Fusobacterium periodonticum]
MLREDGRKFNEERKIKITKDVNIYAEGSVLIEVGNTKVICTASVSEKVPPFLRGTGKGWVTAEYSMLPRATNERNQREASKGKLTGRTVEIQRLIGRTLRSAIDLEKLGERLITIDCDVIQADGGTRTTSITGGYVALALAIKKLLKDEILEENPLIANVAAISVGKIDSELMVDLKYSEDSAAEVDMNVIMNKKGEFIEVQGTGEESTFTRTELNGLLDLAEASIKRIIDLQDKVIEQENLKIFLATGNKHKIEEISDIFSDIENVEILSIKDGVEIPEVIEDGTTFEENSKKKAVEIAKFLNMITIADDSGLCVDALNGEPGVYSARYSGTGDDLKNNEKLIENLKGVENRKAKFVSIITLAKPNGETFSFEGEILGEIIDNPRGNTGFGYDPHFYVEEYQKTLAQLPELKNKISHRAKALEKLKKELKNILL